MGFVFGITCTMTKNDTFSLSQKLSQFEPNDRERILRAVELTRENSAAGGDSAGAASILLDLGLDADTVIASLVRLLPESSFDQFGPVPAGLVQGVKKIDSLDTNNRTVQEAQNIRNMIFALTLDIRVIFIALAEKLKELRFLDSSGDDKRKTTARECLDIYAPLADRLGISWIKNEMEDLSLKFLNRETYQQIKSMVSEKKEQRNQFLEFVRDTIKAESEAAGIKVDVESRAKHFYSVYMKMRKRGKSAAEIFDLSGIRIICSSIENCYTLLGIVHRLWKPINNGFKDYIAVPKPNGYRSLHTSVMIEKESGEEARMLEIQIRTEEMHRVAEYGVASHWLYKKGSSRDMVLPEDIAIVNKLKVWNREDKKAPDFSPLWLEDIKAEILKNRVYVFTPMGKVIKLPSGATPIDFAYQIHTAIGDHCIGAKANDSIIPLSSPLKNTQVVEIMTSSQAHPHFNWLELAKSSKARGKIRSWLEKNDESFFTDKITEPKKKPVPDTAAVVPLADKRAQAQKPVQPLASVLQVRIEDEKNMMIRFARCCNPAPGDSITGYVSRGRGIIIHCENCPNLARNPEAEYRIIAARWENARPEPPKHVKNGEKH